MLPTPLSFPAHKMQKVRSENRIALFLCERELARLGIGVEAALGVMAWAWPLRPRSLRADPCASERVMVSASRRG